MSIFLVAEGLSPQDELLLSKVCSEMDITFMDTAFVLGRLLNLGHDDHLIILLTVTPTSNLMKIRVRAISDQYPKARIIYAFSSFNAHTASTTYSAGCHAVCPLPLDVSFLKAKLSDQVAIIERSILANQLAKLEEAYNTTIEGWVRTLDLRDKETETHSIRVSELAVRLAKRMGLAKNEIKKIRIGSLLHDIGKIAIPDAILQKKGTLTYDERAIMERHPEYAYVMLMGIDYLDGALEIPYSHHEKFDGTGYPLGLSGEEIPLSARIFGIIDVYDAFVSDRPYKETLSHEEAIEQIKQMVGTHFDGSIVEHFVKMMSDFNRNAA